MFYRGLPLMLIWILETWGDFTDERRIHHYTMKVGENIQSLSSLSSFSVKVAGIMSGSKDLNMPS